jgi:TRAP-type C4-dicarboxylate transport system substrate-binding protein
MNKSLFTLVATCALTSTTWAQTKWDLPSAYPAGNFHTENLNQFAKDVESATGGKL